MAHAAQRFRAGREHLRVVAPQEKKAPKTSDRVLRLGVVENGRIIDEQLVRQRTSVTVGPSERNQIVIPTTEISSRFQLFSLRGGVYHLTFTESMSGRVTLDDGVADLQTLRHTGRAQRRGSTWQVELPEESRGKITIGDHTLLFQMVKPPPIQPAPQLPASVRSGWLRSIDWVMIAFVAVSFVIQVGLVTWLVHRDWPVVPTWAGTSDGLLEHVVNTPPSQAQINDALRPPAKAPAMPDPSPGAVAEEDPGPAMRPARRPGASPSQGSSGSPDPGPNKGTGDAERRARVAAALDVARIKLIGARHPGEGDGVVADVLRGGEVSGDLDTIMEQVKGVKVANNNETVFRRPASGGTDGTGQPLDIDGLRATSGSAPSVDSGDFGEEREVSGDVGRGNPSPPRGTGVLDDRVVRRVVGSHLGGIKRCYERELRHRRTLEGRLTVNFTIGAGGRVVRSSVSQDTLGSAAVSSCIEGQFRRMSFPEPSGGNVSFSYPFFFRVSR